jgi:predicted ATPase
MLLKRLALQKILSFKDSAIELGPLNVLIGPNAVGKSNLIEAISLLKAAPTNLADEMLRGGGVRQWIWLGDPVASPVATLECDLVLSRGRQVGPLTYLLQFSEDARGFLILEEQLVAGNGRSKAANGKTYFKRSSNYAKFGALARQQAGLDYESNAIPSTESVLSRFKSPIDATPITEVGRHLEEIKIFREFRTAATSQTRWGISTSIPKGSLMDGGDNLALVLHDLDFLGVHDRIRDYLRRFCKRFEDVKVNVGQGIAQAYLRESGLTELLSARRMSDGTLKFLCLLAALFHPKPPPLMCIEDPELGLHPEALQLVAEALVESSESTQLVVTTHSDALVDALSDRPEAVIVCERDFDNGTQCKRLSRKQLREWLKHYTLGALWRKGEIGGGRW